MTLDKGLIEGFCEFMESEYGSKKIETNFKGELWRFMVKGEKLVVIRDHPLPSKDTVEVFCSSKVLLRTIGDTYYSFIAGQINEA